MTDIMKDIQEGGKDASPVDQLIGSFESTQSAVKDATADIIAGNAGEEVPVEGERRTMTQSEREDIEDILMRM